MTKKIISLITLLCFVLSGIAGPAASAALPDVRGSSAVSRPLDEFLLPYTLGRVTRSQHLGSKQVVVNIQDLHCHPEVQRNIKNIIAALARRYPVSRIYLEGAYGRVDTSWLASIADKGLREQVVESLVDQGKLTGVEYYAAEVGDKDPVFGLENRELHAQALSHLNKILRERDTIQKTLDLLRQEIGPVKQAYYGPKHRELERIVEQHRQGLADTKKYYRVLRKYAEACGLDVSGYRNVSGFMELMRQEKEIKYPRVASQLQELMLLLKEKLPYRVYASLIEQIAHPASLDEVYLRLAEAARAYELGVASRLPDLARFFAYVRASQQINPLQLVKEEQRLLFDLERRISTSQAERDVVFLAHFFDYLSDYFTNKISCEDHEYYLANIDRFRSLWVTYTGNRKIAVLDRNAGLFDAYYRANLERNHWFVRNMLGDDAQSGFPKDLLPVNSSGAATFSMLKEADEILVVVAGGFHTPGLADLLRQRNISYLVITPNVTRANTFAEKVYTELAQEQSAFPGQSLALLDLSQNPNIKKAREIAAILIPLLLQKKFSVAEINAEINAVFSEIVPPGSGQAPVRFELKKSGAKEYRFTMASGTSLVQFACTMARDGTFKAHSLSQNIKDRAGKKGEDPRLPASVLGVEYAGAAPFWETAYALPYANAIARNLVGRISPRLAEKVGSSSLSSRIDGIVSLALLGCVAGSMLSGAWPLVALSSMAYSLGRGYVFGAAHAWATPQRKAVLSAIGTVFAGAFILPAALFPFGLALPFSGIVDVLLAGTGLNMLAHYLYNYAVFAGWLPRIFPPANIVAPGDSSPERIRHLLAALGNDNRSGEAQAERELGALGVRATAPLLKILDETDDFLFLEKVYLAFLATRDYTALPELQNRYLRLGDRDRDRKGWISLILRRLMESSIPTVSPVAGQPDSRGTIDRLTFPHRLDTAKAYILRQIDRSAPGEIGTIVDCAASDASSITDIAGAVHSRDGRILCIGMDIGMALYKVTDPNGGIALFDSRDNLLWLYANGETWANSSRGWIKNGKLTFARPDNTLTGHFKKVRQTMPATADGKVRVSARGIIPDIYAGQHGSMETLYLISPEALALAGQSRLEFRQGDFFAFRDHFPAESIDIAVAGNVLGNCWRYYDQAATRRALEEIGRGLKQKGKLIVGNNSPPRLASDDFRFHVYERQGDELKLVFTTEGDPMVWEGDPIETIGLSPPKIAVARAAAPRPLLGFAGQELQALMTEYLQLTFPGVLRLGTMQSLSVEVAGWLYENSTGAPLLDTERYAAGIIGVKEEILKNREYLDRLGLSPEESAITVKAVKGRFLHGDARGIGLASIAVNNGEMTFYVTEGLLNIVQSRAPPRLLEFLVSHELEEYLYLKEHPGTTFRDFHALTAEKYKDLFSLLKEQVFAAMAGMGPMKMIFDSIMDEADITLIDRLQNLYFSAEEKGNKELLYRVLRRLMTYSKFIYAYSPMGGTSNKELIERFSFTDRLSRARDYIARLVQQNPGTVRTIVDCSASDATSALPIAQAVHRLDEQIRFIAMDLSMILYEVTDAKGTTAVFDSIGDLIRVYEEGVTWVKVEGGWLKNDQPAAGPDADTVVRLRGLRVTLGSHLGKDIFVSGRGIPAKTYTDASGNRIKAVYLVNPRAVEWAQGHRLEFRQGNFFRMQETVPAASADIALVGNVLGYHWGCYGQEATLEALKEIGLILRENGKLLVGNNTHGGRAKFQFHVYERRGNALILIDTIGTPAVWQGEEVREIRLAPEVDALPPGENGAAAEPEETSFDELMKRPIPVLLDLFERTNDSGLMEDISSVLLLRGDVTFVPRFNRLYFTTNDQEKKRWILWALESLSDYSDYHLYTLSSRGGKAIAKTSSANRLESAGKYISGLLKENPSGINTIVDFCVSDGRATVGIAKAVQSEYGHVAITGVDLNAVMYAVTDTGGTTAVFDAQGNLLRLQREGATLIKTKRGWYKDSWPASGPDNETAGRLAHLQQSMRGHLRNQVAVSGEGILPDIWTDGQGNRIEAIYFVNPKAVEWAFGHKLGFLQGDMFQAEKLFRKESVDIALVGNALGARWGYFDRGTTIEALQSMGKVLREGGKLIVGNNAGYNDSVTNFQFHVYERQGDALRLIHTVGSPAMWEGDAVREIAVGKKDPGETLVEAAMEYLREISPGTVHMAALRKMAEYIASGAEEDAAGTIPPADVVVLEIKEVITDAVESRLVWEEGIRDIHALPGKVVTAHFNADKEVRANTDNIAGGVMVALSGINSQGRIILRVAHLTGEQLKGEDNACSRTLTRLARELFRRDTRNLKAFVCYDSKVAEDKKLRDRDFLKVECPFLRGLTVERLQGDEKVFMTFGAEEASLRYVSDQEEETVRYGMNLRIGRFLLATEGTASGNTIILPTPEWGTMERVWLREMYGDALYSPGEVYLHRSTRDIIGIMLRLDENIGFKDRVVMDVGSGNGILSVVADRLGAKKVYAVDSDRWITRFAQKVAALNETKNVEFVNERFEDLPRNLPVDILLMNLGGQNSEDAIRLLLRDHPQVKYIITSGTNIRNKSSPLLKEMTDFLQGIGEIISLDFCEGYTGFADVPYEMYPIYVVKVNAGRAQEEPSLSEKIKVQAPAQWDPQIQGAEPRFKPEFVREAIEDGLTGDNGSAVSEILAAMEIDAAEVDSVNVSFAQEGIYYGVFRADVGLKNGETRYFGIDIALNDALNRLVEEDHRSLLSLQEAGDTHGLDFVPRIYGLVEGNFKVNAGESVGLKFLAVEWMKEHVEIHRDRYVNGQNFYLIPNYIEEKNGLNGRRFNAAESSYFRKKMIAFLASMFIASLDGEGRGLVVKGMSINSGDFVVRPLGNGEYDLRLITARGLERMTPARFIDYLLTYENEEYREIKVTRGFTDASVKTFRFYEHESEVYEGIRGALATLYGEQQGRETYDLWIAERHRVPQGLSNGLDTLIKELYETNPLLAQFLVKPSVRLAELIVDETPRRAEEGIPYHDYFETLRAHLLAGLHTQLGISPDEEIDMKLVTLRNVELARSQNACLLATMGLEKYRDPHSGKVSTTVIFSGHELLWDALRMRGPPEGFTVETVIGLLVRHEIDEYIALDAALALDPRIIERNPWLKGFNEYLSTNDLPRTMDAFHGYIRELASNKEGLTEDGRVLARQVALLQFAGNLPEASRIVHITEYPKGLKKEEFAALDNVTLKGCRLDASGRLSLAGNRNLVKFNRYPGREIEIDVRGGVAVAVRVTDNGKVLAEKKLSVVYDNGTGKALFSFSNIQKSKLADLKNVTIAGVVTGNDGHVEMGNYTGHFKRFPGAELELVIENGGVAKVRFLRDSRGLPVLDVNGRALEIDTKKDIQVQIFENAREVQAQRAAQSLQQFAQGQELFRAGRYTEAADLFERIIKRARRRKIPLAGEDSLRGQARVHLAACAAENAFAKGRYRSALEIYWGILSHIPRETYLRSFAERRIAECTASIAKAGEGGREEKRTYRQVARGVEVPPGPEMIDLPDYPGGIPAAEFAKLETAVIKGYVLKKNGALYLGQRTWAHFHGHDGETVTVHVRHGFVTGVVFTDGSEEGFSTVVENSTGRIIDAFHERLQKQRLNGFTDVTIKDVPLDKYGRLRFGNNRTTQFEDRANEKVDVVIQGGFIRKVVFQKDAAEEEFALIFDNETGRLVDSFYNVMTGARLKTLENATIRNFKLSGWGNLSLGGRLWTSFKERAGEKIDISIRDGVITSVLFLKDRHQEKFVLIVDKKGGRILNSFLANMPAEALKKLDGVIIRNVFLDAYGDLTLGNQYQGKLAEYPYAEVEASVDKGKVTAVTVVRDREGNAVRDVDGNKLKIDLTGNVRAQLYERSPIAQRKLLADSVRLFKEGEELLEGGEPRRAARQFARVVARIKNREKPVPAESSLSRKAEAGIEKCREKTLLGTAEKYFGEGKYRVALRKYEHLLNGLRETDEAYGAALEMIERCNAEIQKKKKTQKKERPAKKRATRTKKEKVPSGTVTFRLRHHYLEDVPLSNGELSDLLETIRAGGSEDAVEARNTIVDRNVRLVMEIATRRVNGEPLRFPDYAEDFYDDLTSEGILALYDIVDAYALENEGPDFPFEQYARRELKSFFDTLRKKRNREAYGVRSLNAPAKGHRAKEESKVTLEDFLGSKEISPTEITERREELSVVRSALGQLADNRDREIVFRALEEGFTAAEIAEKMNLSVEQVVGVLTRTLALLDLSPALGKNLNELVAHAVAVLRETDPGARLLKELLEDSCDVSRRIVLLFRGGRNVSEEYRGSVALLSRSQEIDEIEVWDSEYLISEDGWSLAALEPDRRGHAKLLVNNVFFEALRALGPPEDFRPASTEETRREEFLKLLLAHELFEFSALNDKGSEIHRLLIDYLLRENPGLSDDALKALLAPETFHAYLRSVAATARDNVRPLSATEQALAEQVYLLEFADRAVQWKRLKDRLNDPFLLYFFDMDNTITRDRDPLDEAMERMFNAIRNLNPEAELGVISGASVESVRERVGKRIRSLWTYGDGGGRGFIPANQSNDAPDYFVPLAQSPEEKTALKDTVAATLDAFGVPVEDREFKEKPSEYTVGIKGSEYLFRRRVVEGLRKVLPDGYRVANTSIAIEIFRADKSDALADVAKRVAAAKGSAPAGVLSRAFVAGDSENDIPMLNMVARAGGVAVYVGEHAEGILPGVFVMPVKGPEGTGRVLEQHAAALFIKRIEAALANVNDRLYAVLEEEFSRVIRERGSFMLCGDASYIMALILSERLGLPIGGSAPDRIELVTGTVNYSEDRTPLVHRWLALYHGGRKMMLIDPTYAQFNAKFSGKILAGDYDRVAREHGYLEWDELLSALYARYENRGASREEILRKLRQARPLGRAPLLVRLQDFSSEVENVQRGDFSRSSFYGESRRMRLGKIVETILQGRDQAVSSAARAAIRSARDVAGAEFVPLKAAQDASGEIAGRAVSSEGWLKERAPHVAEKASFSVYYDVSDHDRQALRYRNDAGMRTIGITRGKPEGQKERVCDLSLLLPGLPKPLEVRVWAVRQEKGGAPAALLYLDNSYLTASIPGNAVYQRMLFGRSALQLIRRIADDRVVQDRLRQLGMDHRNYVPGIIECHGVSSVFAFPGLVRDGSKNVFAQAVLGFVVKEEDEPGATIPASFVSALNLDREYVRDAIEDGRLDLLHLALSLSDVALAEGNAGKQYPWFPAAEDLPQTVRTLAARYESAVMVKAARSVMRRRSNVVLKTSIPRLRTVPERNDTGKGGLPDLMTYIDEIKGTPVSVVQIESLFDDAHPFALHDDVLDRARPWTGDGDSDAFSAFYRAMEKRLPSGRGDAREEAHFQFVAYTELRKALDHAHAADKEVFFDCPIAENTDLDALRQALRHWVLFGFDGAQLNVSRPDRIREPWLSAVLADVRRVNPDATLVIALPKNTPAALREKYKSLGFIVAQQCAPGETPGSLADHSTWLEMSWTERNYVRDQAALKRWVREFVESEAVYVALPDAARWGGYVQEGVTFRNPSPGEREFDITGYIVSLIEERRGAPERSRLFGWTYERGYADGLSLAPDPAKVGWSALREEHSLALSGPASRRISAPGLHALLSALRYLRSDQTLARDSLTYHCVANEGNFFAFVYSALSRVPGFGEEEWPAGWHYLRNLDKRARSASHADRKIQYNLQMLEFVQGVLEGMLEGRYVAARLGPRGKAPEKDGDRQTFRALLRWADASFGIEEFSGTGISSGREMPEEVVSYITSEIGSKEDRDLWAGLAGAAGGDPAQYRGMLETARGRLSGLDRNEVPLRAVLALIYMKALTRLSGEEQTKYELQPQLRGIIDGVADIVSAGNSEGAFSIESGVHRWVIADFLRIYDVFCEFDHGKLDVEEILDGAIDPLGVERIRSAA